ncbi:protein draper-like [Gigantopelta aegis]|uniref:protein draper-like n=1 Tax=Gigantopelta aegis TaxID=1735272 RepID=UPI001B88BDED|nr:protein draper-like [Gigantopelta aegis]
MAAYAYDSIARCMLHRRLLSAGICSPRMYGLHCNYTCHCDAVDCDDVTGCQRRCHRGWHGSNCNEENIALDKPASQSSHHSRWWKNASLAVDGNLNQGYQAANFCAPGTFGDDCTSFCNCLNGSCDYVTGECTGGCQQNWTGITCSECDSDLYGHLCNKSCSSRHCDESNANSSCINVLMYQSDWTM